MKNSNKVETYTGLVQIFPNTAEIGSVRAVLVQEDGSKIPILHRGAAVDILGNIGASVRIEGFLEKAPEVEVGEALKVCSYVITDGYENSWYDDED